MPETVNVTISNPGVDALRTEVSAMALGLAAFYTATNKKLNLILDSIGSANDAAAIAKIRAAAAQLKADTDKLEGEVQKHNPEGQG